MEVLAPTKGTRRGQVYQYTATFQVPAVESAKQRWQAREDALKAGYVTLGSRLKFIFDSDEFMTTTGGTLTLLVEIADVGLGNWRRYVQSTHESGLRVKPARSLDDPQTWSLPSATPDLWDGNAYDCRITATCTLNVTASLHYDVRL